jgi:hypothetical protein
LCSVFFYGQNFRVLVRSQSGQNPASLLAARTLTVSPEFNATSTPSTVRQKLAARVYSHRESSPLSKLTSPALSLFVMSIGGRRDLDLRACFCFFEWMTGHLGASAPLPLWWQGSAAAKPLYHCLHDTDFNILENRSISHSLLTLSTGGTCTFSAVTAAAAHHPQLDRAQMASKSLKQV